MELHLTEQQTEKLVKEILNDAVIFERTSRGVQAILRAYQPDAEYWRVDEQYNGIGKAYELVGCSLEYCDEYIVNVLHDRFHNYVTEDLARDMNYRVNATTLANQIYSDWVDIVKDARFKESIKKTA